MDSRGKQAIIGKYYDLDNMNNVQYIGLNKTGCFYVFQWRNPRGQFVIIRRVIDNAMTLIQKPTYDETDEEYLDDPYDSDDTLFEM